jgi:2-ketocyclohexanecarboxyl-CoA hydrolase
LAIAKCSFNSDTAHQAGIAGLGMYALKEKRKPAFRKDAK